MTSQNMEVTPADVLNKLKLVLKFLSTTLLNLNVDKKHNDNSSTKCLLMTLFGNHCCDQLINIIIEDCLARSVPTNHRDLPKFEMVKDSTVAFQKDLVTLGFLSASNTALTDYVGNVNLLFANKKCQEILERARTLMMGDIHNIVKVADSQCSEKGILNLDGASSKKMKINENLTSSDNTKLSSVYHFPCCYIRSVDHSCFELTFVTDRIHYNTK